MRKFKEQHQKMPNIHAFPDMTKPMLKDCGFF